MNAQDARNMMLMDIYDSIRECVRIQETEYVYMGKLNPYTKQKLQEGPHPFTVKEIKSEYSGYKTVISWMPEK